MSTRRRSEESAEEGREVATRSGADRLLSGIFAIVIIAVVAVLVTSEINGSSGPAEFDTRMRPVTSLGDAHQLPVVVENVGGATATKVDVTAEVQLSGDELTGTSTIDFLAPREQATVVFVFPSDPRDGNISVAVRSYVEP